MNSERKNYPMKEFRGNFFDFINFGQNVCKKRPVFNIKLYFKMYGIYINLGCQIWIQNAKITLWKNFGQFFRFHRFWSSGSGYGKKYHFSILAVIQSIWDLHKFGLQIWIQNVKITLWKNFVQFFRFHQFWSKCMRKKASF